MSICTIPLYCPNLQLLGGLLEVNPGYVRDIEGMGLASQFFDFLSLEHANNNVHNIRLCRQVTRGGMSGAVRRCGNSRGHLNPESKVRWP